MTNENTPKYIIDLKSDLISHMDKGFDILDKKITREINELALMINKTVVMKEDIVDMATKEDIIDMAKKKDIEDIRSKMATNADMEELKQKISTMADKDDIDKVLSHIGDYEVRTKKLEKFVYS